MDFELTEEQKLVQASVRQFMLGEIAPDTERIDREARFPEGIWRRLGELGLLGASVDEAYGGTGLGLLTGVLIVEEMARTCAPALCSSSYRSRYALSSRFHPGVKALGKKASTTGPLSSISVSTCRSPSVSTASNGGAWSPTLISAMGFSF